MSSDADSQDFNQVELLTLTLLLTSFSDVHGKVVRKVILKLIVFGAYNMIYLTHITWYT